MSDTSHPVLNPLWARPAWVDGMLDQPMALISPLRALLASPRR